jgi:dienelactone hydrolase
VRAGVIATVGIAALAMLAAGCSAGSSDSATHSASGGRASATRVTSTPAGRGAAGRADTRPVIGVARTYWAGWRSITMTEPAHVGPDGHLLGARRLLIQIWYPLAGRPSKTNRPAAGPFPMIAFAPGFMQCGGPYGDMLKYWATAGYVVVVVNFPHADCKVGAAATESDLLNEPQDLSYAITRMLAFSRAKRGVFAGRLSPARIAIAGQSDGGDVVAAIAGNTCCSDRRVVAVAVESGAEWPPMAGVYFTHRTVPVLFSQGTADTINPPGCSADMYLADRSSPRYYLDLFGASHTEPYWGVNRYERIVARVTLAFFDRYVLGRKSQQQVLRRRGNVPGLAAIYSAGRGVASGYCNT